MTVRFTSTESKFFAVKELCYVSPLLKTRVEITFRKYPPNPRGHIQDTPQVSVLTFLSFTVDLDYFLTTCKPHALGSLERLPKTPFPAIQKDKEVLPHSRIRGWSKKMSRGLEQCMAPPCSLSWCQQLWLQWPQYFVSAYGELSATVRLVSVSSQLPSMHQAPSKPPLPSWNEFDSSLSLSTFITVKLRSHPHSLVGFFI